MQPGALVSQYLFFIVRKMPQEHQKKTDFRQNICSSFLFLLHKKHTIQTFHRSLGSFFFLLLMFPRLLKVHTSQALQSFLLLSIKLTPCQITNKVLNSNCEFQGCWIEHDWFNMFFWSDLYLCVDTISKRKVWAWVGKRKCLTPNYSRTICCSLLHWFHSALLLGRSCFKNEELGNYTPEKVSWVVSCAAVNKNVFFVIPQNNYKSDFFHLHL